VIVFTGGGFEPGDVGNYFFSAYKSDEPLPENPEGNRLLQEKIKAAAGPPDPEPVAPLPEIVSMISEKTILLDANSYGLRSISLTFEEKDEVVVSIEYEDSRREARPIGLDNVYRISPDGRFGLPVALKGSWEGEREFVFSYNDVANINRYIISMVFEGQVVEMRIREATGLSESSFLGRIQE